MKKHALALALSMFSAALYAQTAKEIEMVSRAKAMFETTPSNLKVKYTLDSVLKFNPDNEQANYTRGLYELKNGSRAKAEQYISKAISISPDNADYYWSRARVNMIYTSDVNVHLKAISDLDKVLQLGGQSYKVHSQKALIEREIASDYFNQAQRVDTKSMDTYTDDNSTLNDKKKNLLALASDFANKAASSIDRGLAISSDEPSGIQLKSMIATLQHNIQVEGNATAKK